MSAKRRRLDSIVSVRFTPEQIDQIRAQVGEDGSVSAYIRDTVLRSVFPPVPRRTYQCAHLSMSGYFAQPPTCGQGCTLAERPTRDASMPTLYLNLQRTA